MYAFSKAGPQSLDDAKCAPPIITLIYISVGAIDWASLIYFASSIDLVSSMKKKNLHQKKKKEEKKKHLHRMKKVKKKVKKKHPIQMEKKIIQFQWRRRQ